MPGSTESTRALAVWLIKSPDVLLRATGLFARRGLEIEGLTVGDSGNDGLWLMTLKAEAEPSEWVQLTERLRKIIGVIHVNGVIREDEETKDPRLIDG
ncbi:ACT domain-containing protein [Cohnella suwonensis]|uniref:ACT domain-containing protein n=1 Tax=Cohnella suwonensis TaxID=696072 RepID=A0ABW0LQQ1_9BACL